MIFVPEARSAFIQLVAWFFPRVKRTEREANESPQATSEDRKE
jgi:hypothetical protein